MTTLACVCIVTIIHSTNIVGASSAPGSVLSMGDTAATKIKHSALMDLTFYLEDTDNEDDNTLSCSVGYEEVEKNQAGSGTFQESETPSSQTCNSPSIPFLPAPLPSLSPPISNPCPNVGQAPLLRSRLVV